MDSREVSVLLLPMSLMGAFMRAVGHATLRAEHLASESMRRALDEATFSIRRPDEPAGPPSAWRSTPAVGEPTVPPQPQGSIFEPQPLTQSTGSPPSADSQTHHKEKTMADTNLNDDMVKLVQYAIVSIKRREERIVTSGVDGEALQGRPMLYLETDNITGDGFSNARIADWVRDHPAAAKDVDLDSLRVYYDVLDRWPRSSLKYEEERLDIEDEKLKLLQEIAKGK